MAAANRTAAWLAAILAWAAVQRVLYVVWFRAHDPFWNRLFHDAAVYDEWARALAAGEPYGAGAFYQAPAYPYVVAGAYALTRPEPPTLYLLQSLAGLATIAVTFVVTRRAYGERAALLAAALLALCGVLSFHETKLLPGSFALLAATALVERLQAADRGVGLGRWAVAGALAGFSVLLRPEFLLLVPAAAVWALVDRTRAWADRAWRAAAWCLFAALVVAPVTWINLRASGDFVPVSTSGGVAFLHGNHAGADGWFAAPPGYSGSIRDQREEARRLARTALGRAAGDHAASGVAVRQALDWIAAHPAAAAQLLGRKLFLALDHRELPLEYHPDLDPNPWRALAPLGFALLLAFAALRPLASRGWRRAETPLLLVLGVTLTTLLLFYVSSRFRLPAYAPLAALAGCGLASAGDRLRGGLARFVPPLLVALAVGAFSLAPLPGSAERRLTRLDAMGFDDRGTAFLLEGRNEEARVALRHGVLADPAYPPVRLDLAKALAADGDVDAARNELRIVLRQAPELAEAHFDLGVLEFGVGRLREAAEAFEAAWRLDPDDPAAANNLLGTLLRAGERVRAGRLAAEMRSRGVPLDAALERALGPLASLPPGGIR